MGARSNPAPMPPGHHQGAVLPASPSPTSPDSGSAGSPPVSPVPRSLAHESSAALGASLAPALDAECGGRLSGIEWFRCVWQRGGAATGFAQWKGDDGEKHPVMVKVPVGPIEYQWTMRLSGAGDGAQSASPTPRVFAGGESLGGHDLAWLVMERLPGHTLTTGWCRESLEQLLAAAAAFHARAAKLGQPAGGSSLQVAMDWESQLSRAREAARQALFPEAQRWNEALKKVQKVLPKLASRWESRPINTWCHGDLHPGNALRRRDSDPSCVLIDLALVHPGHWIEDAVYLERQFWGRPEALFELHPVSHLAKMRRECGLATDGDYGGVANLRRVLMAACAPAHLAGDGHPRYLHAALEVLERLLPQVSR
jgi:hypothetical protein